MDRDFSIILRAGFGTRQPVIILFVSPELIAAHLTEALETNDQTLIIKAIGNAARSRGMTEVAEKAGVSRENLYRALRGDVKPEFGTIIKVLQALGISLVAQAQNAPRAA